MFRNYLVTAYRNLLVSSWTHSLTEAGGAARANPMEAIRHD
jgi:hypothetical protein